MVICCDWPSGLAFGQRAKPRHRGSFGAIHLPWSDMTGCELLIRSAYIVSLWRVSVKVGSRSASSAYGNASIVSIVRRSRWSRREHVA